MSPKALLAMVLMVVSMVFMASTEVLADDDGSFVIDLDENVGWYKHYHSVVHLSESASSLLQVLDILPHDVANPSAVTPQQRDAHRLETAALFLTVREFDLYFPNCGNYSMLVDEQRALVEQHVTNLTDEAVESKRGALMVALAQKVGHYVRSVAYDMFSQAVEHISSLQQEWEDFAMSVGSSPLLSSGMMEPLGTPLESSALKAKINQLGRDEQDKYEYAFQNVVTLRTKAFAHLLTGVANLVWKDLGALKTGHAQEEVAIYASPNNTAELLMHARRILHQIEQVMGPSAASNALFLELQSRADTRSLELLERLPTTNEGLTEIPEESDSTPQTKSNSDKDPIPPPTHSRKTRSVEGQRMRLKAFMQFRGGRIRLRAIRRRSKQYKKNG